ncbi:COMM domain-containing protein 7, partial [Nibea albiflora]
QWGEHYAALSRLAVRQTLMVNQLVDMEWKFGVTVGTSEVQKVGNIFLQMHPWAINSDLLFISTLATSSDPPVASSASEEPSDAASVMKAAPIDQADWPSPPTDESPSWRHADRTERWVNLPHQLGGRVVSFREPCAPSAHDGDPTAQTRTNRSASSSLFGGVNTDSVSEEEEEVIGGEEQEEEAVTDESPTGQADRATLQTGVSPNLHRPAEQSASRSHCSRGNHIHAGRWSRRSRRSRSSRRSRTLEEVCSGCLELHLARFGIPESAAASRCVRSSALVRNNQRGGRKVDPHGSVLRRSLKKRDFVERFGMEGAI